MTDHEGEVRERAKKYMLPGGIYQIKNLVNGKVYVGHATCIRRRFSGHLLMLRRGRHDNPHLQRAWNLYGPESFELSILEFVQDPYQLVAREAHWFAVLNVLADGYNMLPPSGSRFGTKLSEETKQKIREKMLGRFVSNETRALKSKASKGRRLSDEQKQKLSVIRKAMYASNPDLGKAHGDKIRGRKLPPDSIAKREATKAANRLSKESL